MPKVPMDPSNSNLSPNEDTPYVLYSCATAIEGYKALTREGRIPISAAEMILLRTAPNLPTVDRRTHSILAAETIYTGTFVLATKEKYQSPVLVDVHKWSDLNHNKIGWHQSYGQTRLAPKDKEEPIYLPKHPSTDSELKRLLLANVFGDLTELIASQMQIYQGNHSSTSSNTKGFAGMLTLDSFGQRDCAPGEGKLFPIGVGPLSPNHGHFMHLYMKPRIVTTRGLVNVIGVRPEVAHRQSALSTLGIESSTTPDLLQALSQTYR